MNAVESAKVRLKVEFAAVPGELEQILDALRFLMTKTRLDQGCLQCTVSIDHEGTVHYAEEWASEADMRRRARSTQFTSLLSVMEEALEAPQVEFDFVARTRGLDYIAEVRQGEHGAS
jgi:quinol monooxygenase YgiN